MLYIIIIDKINKFNIKEYIKYNLLFLNFNYGDWGLGIGDWGLGIGPNPQSPIPNPQSPSPLRNKLFLN